MSAVVPIQHTGHTQCSVTSLFLIYHWNILMTLHQNLP